MELERTNKRKASVKTLLCVLTLAVLFALLLWRVPFGYDWTDEQYYSEVGYRLLQGDRLLVDTWEVHQFSAMLTAPVLKVYLLFNNASTDGIVLYLRYFYITLQLFVSAVAFFVLKKRSGYFPALICACLLLAYSHFSINSYFYNSMVLLFSILSALMCMSFFTRSAGGFIFAALGGICFALAVIAYPYFLLFIPVYIGFWIVRARDKNLRSRNGYGAISFFAGTIVVASAFIFFLLSRASASQLLNGISNMLSDPDHQSQSLLEVMGQYFNAIRVVYSPASYGAAALFLLGLLYASSKRENVRRILRRSGGVGVILLMFSVVWIALCYDWNGIYRINLLAMGFAVIAPGLFFLTDRKKDEGTLLLYWIGCGLSFAVQIGSNTRLLASSGMLLPASMATVIYLFDHAKELFRWNLNTEAATPRRSIGWFSGLRIAACVACVACVAGLMCLRVTAVHRDAPIAKLTTKIGSGAAKGIYTTQESAALHGRLIADIRAYAPKSGTILISYLFPEGYLVTGLSAATPSAFNMAMNSAWLESYYEQHPERRPDYVVALDPSMLYNEDGQAGIETFSNNADYERYDLSTGTVFVRKTS